MLQNKTESLTFEIEMHSMRDQDANYYHMASWNAAAAVTPSLIPSWKTWNFQLT